MPQQYRKKLIEVALPLDAINRAAIREKTTRFGHPSTIHIWWARRPLASCRAVLFATLVDDPSNDFPEDKARKERDKLFRIIEKIVLWENTANRSVFKEANQYIRKSLGDELPTVLDPFCGSGSISLEAERLGLNTLASDLNPVAVMVAKALVEIPTKFANKRSVNPDTIDRKEKFEHKNVDGLAADITYYGKWIRNEAEKRIGHLYPKINGKNVIVWKWARTVKCPNPACGFFMPLAKTFELSKKSKKAWVKVVRNNKTKSAEFEVINGEGSPPAATVNRKGARCIFCDNPVPFAYIRNEGKEGRMQYLLMAIILEGDRGTTYLSPIKEHVTLLENIKPSYFPNIELPKNTRDFKTPLYGMKRFGDLFTSRQLIALTTFSDLIPIVREKILKDALEAGFESDDTSLNDGGTGARAYADAVATYLGLAVDRGADYWSTIARWGGGYIGNTFQRQAIPMAWDFAEGNPFSNSTGSWSGAIDWISLCIKRSSNPSAKGTVNQLDATSVIMPTSYPFICTDPPYYNNIGYAELSDYFYIWLRRSLGKIYPMLFSTLLTPKSEELVAAPHRFENDKKKANEHFLSGLKKAFGLFRDKGSSIPLTLFYAFKESDNESDDSGESKFSSIGWEALLEALISTGFQITGTWPMRTEMPNRSISIDANALASSIVLVCRPKFSDSPLATRREFISNLKKELQPAIMNQLHSNIAPVDLAQASIGPGMAVFSRYSKVLEADGKQMSVKTALQIINQELDSYLNSQENELDQETRFCLSWFEQYGTEVGEYGQANVLARAKNTNVERLQNSSLIKAGSGKVRLLRRNELPNDLDLSKVDRLSVWLCMQELIRKLELGGETEAAKLVQKIGAGQSEIAKDLAYRMFSFCGKKGWNEEALSYNNLILSWPAIQERAGLADVPLGQRRL